MDIPPEVKEVLQKAAPGAAGSFTAFLLMVVKGEKLKHALLLLIGGVIVANYMAPIAAVIMRSTEGVAGFVVGVFGCAIIANALDTISKFEGSKAARELWLAFLKRVRG